MNTPARPLPPACLARRAWLAAAWAPVAAALGQEKKTGPDVAPLKPESLEGFAKQPAHVQKLLTYALSLTERSLAYTFGSADPAQGGMDCSGTVYHIVREQGLPGIPRSSDGQYRWLWEKGLIRAVAGRTFDSWEWQALRPGDLLFWTGTYNAAARRDPPISHVMIYCGTLAGSGRRVMTGASDGRPFDGRPRYGVSAFDFKLPGEDSTARFAGYGPLPWKA